MRERKKIIKKGEKEHHTKEEDRQGPPYPTRSAADKGLPSVTFDYTNVTLRRSRSAAPRPTCRLHYQPDERGRRRSRWEGGGGGAGGKREGVGKQVGRGKGWGSRRRGAVEQVA